VQAELLAALAALSWAVGSLFSAAASSQMGAFAFTRWRLFFALTLLSALALFNGQWRSLDASNVALLALSGFIGIFIGDTALFACMNRLGPRRSGVLFATHAIFSTLLAWLFLGETLWGWTLVGGTLLVSGVMVAIVWGRRESETHVWENTQGSLWAGVVLGLLAAVCQSVATLMIKPLMASGVDAVAASAVRTSASFLAHLLLLWAGAQVAQVQNPLNLKNLHTGQANLVGIFSSLTPILLLPLLWGVYRRRPAWGAWGGAVLAVFGAGLILQR
jgi:drug/metabolite transporter (DMT)-like permease